MTKTQVGRKNGLNCQIMIFESPCETEQQRESGNIEENLDCKLMLLLQLQITCENCSVVTITSFYHLQELVPAVWHMAW
jgi:hypothetical protein